MGDGVPAAVGVERSCCCFFPLKQITTIMAKVVMTPEAVSPTATPAPMATLLYFPPTNHECVKGKVLSVYNAL